MKPLKLNQKGMTLIEVMVSVGIMSVVAAGMASLISYSLSATKHVEQKNEQLDFARTIDLTIADKGLCGIAVGRALPGSYAITAANFAPISLSKFEICDPTVMPSTATCREIWSTAAPKFQSGITITNFTIRGDNTPLGTSSVKPPLWSASYTGPGSPSVAYNKYLATIAISTDKGTSSMGGTTFKNLERKVVVMVNPSNNKIDTCEAVATNIEEACQVVGGVYDPTKTPNCRVAQLTLHPTLYSSELGTSNSYSLVASQTTAGNGSNIAIAGPDPGITFTGINGTPAILPPLDSGGSAIFSNTAAGTLTLRSAPGTTGNLVMASQGNLELYSGGGAAAIAIPTSGAIVMSRDLNIGARTGTAFFWNSTSDRRLKAEIKPHTHALDRILKLRGVSYHWKSDAKKKRTSGFIAQEIRKVIPESVTENEDGFLSVNYNSIISYIADAIKELVQKFDAKAEEQDRRIDELEKNMEELRAELRLLKVRCEEK